MYWRSRARAVRGWSPGLARAGLGFLALVCSEMGENQGSEPARLTFEEEASLSATTTPSQGTLAVPRECHRAISWSYQACTTSANVWEWLRAMSTSRRGHVTRPTLAPLALARLLSSRSRRNSRVHLLLPPDSPVYPTRHRRLPTEHAQPRASRQRSPRLVSLDPQTTASPASLASRTGTYAHPVHRQTMAVRTTYPHTRARGEKN